LLCDGSGWVTVADRKINATCILNRNSAQSIPNDTATKVNVNNQVVDTTARMGDTSGSVITIRRNGRYQVQASWGLVSIFDDTERIISYVRQNGSGVAIFAALSPAAAQTLTATAGGVFDCTAGDTFEIAVEQNTGASQNTSTTAQYLPTLVVTEIPTGG
jgi:hypothetical protein